MPNSELTTRSGFPTRPAICHGLPLSAGLSTPATLAECLIRAALGAPDKGIAYVLHDGSESFQSYSQLLAEAQRVCCGLKTLGLKPGDKVIFQLERSHDFIVAFWGCVLGGFVPVPLSIAPSYGEINSVTKKLYTTWLMLDRPQTVTSGRLAGALATMPNLFPIKDFRVETIERLMITTGEAEQCVAQPDDLAILLLTSGSTGQPKAVMQSQRALLHRSAASAQMNGFSVDDVSLNWLPIDHVGGIVMFHVRDVYLGCQQVQVQSEFVLGEPLRWLDLIERHRATVTWAPNFAYGLINAAVEREANRHWDLSSMRFILNAGEAIVAKTARRFLIHLTRFGLAPTALHPAWGMSETSSAVTYSDRFSLESTADDDAFVEVGEPISGVSVRIVDTRGQIVDDQVAGSLQVKGIPVTSGYYNQGELQQEYFTADGWFRTGDRGFLRDGRLTITGRENDVLIINGANYHSQVIEATVEDLDGVERSFTSACAVRVDGADTDRLAIFFTPRSQSDDKLRDLLRALRQKVVREVGIKPDYLLPVAKGAIPKTTIGKIQRAELSRRFATGEFAAILKQVRILLDLDNQQSNLPRTPLEREVAAIWSEVLGGGAVDVVRPFLEMGGDSLAAMRIVSRVLKEYRLQIPVQSLFESSTVAQMAELVSACQNQPIEGEELEKLLIEIEAMSEEEARKLLDERN